MNQNCSESIYIVIPAYNEELNIEKCIMEWYPIVEKYNGGGYSRLVIINDGSMDNTYKILCDLSDTYPLLIPLTKKNGGHGSAVLYGYRYAIDNEADYIFQTDSDGQTNPDEFHAFWDNHEDYDVIIGKREVRGDGKSRKLIENIVCLLLRLYFGVVVEDANAPFRLMKAKILGKYIDKLPEDFNIPNIVFTAFFIYYKERVHFIPISFKKRQDGVNSINVRKVVKWGIKALKDFWQIRKEL